jgi:hypothetical protein
MDVIKYQIHLARQSLERFNSKTLIDPKYFSKPGTVKYILLLCLKLLWDKNVLRTTFYWNLYVIKVIYK